MSAKQFVKAKPLVESKQKIYQRETKKNNKIYIEKCDQQPKDAREHIKIILNHYKAMDRNITINQLTKKYPKIFVKKSLPPQPEFSKNFVDFLWYGSKKENITKTNKQLSEDSSDPNWDTDEDKEVQLVSKKIDQKILTKAQNFISKQPQKKIDELQKHQKQFLQDYYRSRRHQIHNGTINNTKETQTISTMNTQQEEKCQKVKVEKEEQNKKGESMQKTEKNEELNKKESDEDWVEYNPHVGTLIASGYIQKIEKGENEDDFEIDENFSYESEKSNKSSSSDDDDDGMLTDEGPRTYTKTKSDKHHDDQKKQESKAIVKISCHLFSQIAEQVGLQPELCSWVISNKAQRYKVSTQYMNECYKSGGPVELSTTFQYVSLNNSEFVHCDELQTQKGLQKLKRFHDSQKNRKNVSFNKNNNNIKVRKNNNSNVGRAQPHYKQKK